MGIIAKIFLIIIYPFVYILHPRMRQYHALRIKYWAVDRDFFIEEFRTILYAIFAALFGYWSLFYGVGLIHSAWTKGTHEIRQNYNEERRKANLSISSNPEERSPFNTNVVDSTDRVTITKAENIEQIEVIETVEDIKADEVKFELLLEEARLRRLSREQ